MIDLKKEVMSYGVKMTGAQYEWRETKGKGIKVGIINIESEKFRLQIK